MHNTIYGDDVHWRNIICDANTRTIHIVDDMHDHDEEILAAAGGLERVLLQAARAAHGGWSVRRSSFQLQFDGFQCGVWKVYWNNLLAEYARSSHCADLLRFAAAIIARDCQVQVGAERDLFISDLMNGRSSKHRALLSALSARTRQESREALLVANENGTLPFEGAAIAAVPAAPAKAPTFESSHFNVFSVGSVATVENEDESEAVFVESEDGGDAKTDAAAARLVSEMEKVDARRSTFSSTVEIPVGRPGAGRRISKLTLVYELQQGDLSVKTIPLHRLDRIKAMALRAKHANDEDAVALPGEMLHLGDDVALAFIDGSGKYVLWIARVIKILCRVGSRTTQFIRPVSLDTPGLRLVCGYYTEVQTKRKKRKHNAPTSYSYSTSTDTNQYPMSCFLGIVGPLKYDPRSEHYSLSADDVRRVTTSMKAMDIKSGVSKSRAKKRQAKQENYGNDELDGATKKVVKRAPGKRQATETRR